MKLKRLVKYLVFFIFLWLLAHFLILLFVGLTENIKKADAILILGNKVEESGQVSKRLKARLDKGIELFEDDMTPMIIVSGGFGKEGFDEARVMKNYLVGYGVPEDIIIEDGNGDNTYLTAKNFASIAKENNINSVIIVSQYYHLLRSRLAVGKFGFNVTYTSPAKLQLEARDLYSISREMVAYYFYLFKDY